MIAKHLLCCARRSCTELNQRAGNSSDVQHVICADGLKQMRDSVRSKFMIAAVLFAGMAGLPFSEAKAERIKVGSPAATNAFKACSSGGSTIVLQEPAGVKSCINRDGSGIVCGGKTAEQKGTCDTFRRTKDTPWTLTATEVARYDETPSKKIGVQTKGIAAKTAKQP
jgi:hypothetical protein